MQREKTTPLDSSNPLFQWRFSHPWTPSSDQTLIWPLLYLANPRHQAANPKNNREKVTIIQVKIKSPKTDRIGVDTIIDVYESKGPLCPIIDFFKWKQIASHLSNSTPAFRDETGRPLTGASFNNSLKLYLGKYINYKTSRITSHSFRAGMASLLGTLGYTDEDIQAAGRWSSRAFLAYLKLPRTQRLTMAKKIGELNL